MFDDIVYICNYWNVSCNLYAKDHIYFDFKDCRIFIKLEVIPIRAYIIYVYSNTLTLSKLSLLRSILDYV